MLSAELKKIIRGEVRDDEETRKAFSKDASVFEIVPQVVVSPKNSQDLQALVKAVPLLRKKYKNLSLTARSAGTDMSGGPLTESVVVDFIKHFNRMVEVGNGYAVTEPGVYYRDFEKATLKKGWLFPSYPASRELCSVGGIVANNSGGEKSLSYGKTERYVEELNVVLADGKEYVMKPLTKTELSRKLKQKNFEGEVYRKMHKLIISNQKILQEAKPLVSKNSAGYFLWNVWNGKTFDLSKLIVGSQGTLGLVTKIKFKLVRPKSKSAMLVIFLDDLTNLGKITHTVLRYCPESFESYDNNTFKLAMRFIPDLLKRMGGSSILLGIQFIPELWMTFISGVPKLVLIAEFTGEDMHLIKGRLKNAQTEVERLYGVKTRVTDHPQKYWTMRRESFSLLREKVKDKKTAPFIDDFVIKPDYLPEFLPKLNKILQRYPSLIYTIAGHVGDGNFHIIPLMDLSKESERKIIPKLSDEVYDLVLQYKGSITAEHNDGLIRTPYLKKMYGAKIYKLFETTKQIFDPKGIFNPHKKVGGSIEYALEHMKRS
ncbi:MAG: FAD-binding oxidoreductase [Anaplasmataceae bacterium]|nr:FAD-binding oxidoreductase [Anaplasmataceae bacterium]